MKRAVLWLLQPVLDPHKQWPSGPRSMAWAILVAQLLDRPVPTAIAALLLATMFGYSMFKSAIAKSTFAMNATDTVNLTAARTHAIVDTHTITETRLPSKHDDERGDQKR